MKKEVRVGVSIMIFRETEDSVSMDLETELLIGKRKGSHGEGIYSVPGGHIEYGETFEQCCSRELEEEIGVSFDSYTPIDFSEDFFVDKQYTTLYFKANNVNPEIEIKNMEPDKCEGWEWVKIKDLPKLFCNTNNVIDNLLMPF
jgi:8-oxo-dGTP diphosphatase